MQTLEDYIDTLPPGEPMIIMGDFNAHLGVLGGVRGQGDPNVQGLRISL